MSLSVTIYADSSKNRQLADYSNRIHPALGGGGLRFGSGPHGFAACELPLVPMTLDESFAVQNWPGVPWLVVSDHLAGGQWEGRVESRRLVSGEGGGVALTAFGAAAALGDAPYTALWSNTSVRGWRALTVDDISVAYTPEKYQFDTNNRLYAALRKNESYQNTDKIFAMGCPVPNSQNEAIGRFDCDYELNLPTNWVFHIITCDDDFTNRTTQNTVTADATLQSGSIALTFSDAERVMFRIYNNSGSTTSFTGETGTKYITLTNIRYSRIPSSVQASEIAQYIVAHVNGINSDQLSSSTALIEATTDDLQDEIYEDEWPADILDRLALLHGYEWGVWHNQALYFREKGSQGRTFYVDVVAIELDGDIGELINSAYAVYQDANGRLLRSAISNDTDSQEKWGLVRRAALKVNTTSSTQASAHLAAFLADRSDYALRAMVIFENVFDANGGRREMYELRSSDTLVLRNLPANAGPAVDNLRRMRLARAEYTAVPESVSVEPDVPVPTLVTLIARKDAGL